MKRFLIIILTAVSLTAYGQDKYNFVHFNKLTEVVGTEYVIASIENRGKMFETKTQLTDDKFFVRTWTVNKLTGTIVATGHYDTNNNNKYDKTDKSEIHVYDLKSLKLVNKI